jgi:hypothetical protein
MANQELLTISVVELRRLEDWAADQIRSRLVRDGSEFSIKLLNRYGGNFGAIAVVSTFDCVVAWCRSDSWEGKRTLECYTLPSHRRQGYSLMATRALIAGTFMPLEKQIAVFSPAVASMATQAGFLDVREYNQVDGKWLPANQTPPA